MIQLQKYSGVAVALHWAVALLIVANVALGWSVNWVADEKVRPIIDTHKSIGITVLGLALMRLLWRIGHAPPPLPASYASWERRASSLTHALLYVLIFALPLSGWMHDSAWKDAPSHPMSWFGLIPWPRIGWISSIEPASKEHLHNVFGAYHTWFGYLLFALFALHVAGALKHQFVDKEKELQRMGL
jgi:cytochrome b561